MEIAKELTYTWTPGGRLAMVEDSDGHMASMSYDPTGRLASVTAPNGETIGCGPNCRWRTKSPRHLTKVSGCYRQMP